MKGGPSRGCRRRYRGLDLDDASAEHYPAVRAGEGAGQVDDDKSGQGSGGPLVLCPGDVVLVEGLAPLTVMVRSVFSLRRRCGCFPPLHPEPSVVQGSGVGFTYIATGTWRHQRGTPRSLVVRELRMNADQGKAPELPRRFFMGLALATLTACSGGLGSSGAPKGAAGSSDGFVPLSSEDRAVLERAKQSAARADMVRIAGTLSGGDSAVSLDLIIAGAVATGTIRAGGGSSEVRALAGVLYVNGQPTFWDSLARGTGVQFGGKWLSVSAGTAPEFRFVLGLLPVQAALDRWLPEGAGLVGAPNQQVRGVTALGMRRQSGTPVEGLYVATRDPNYPVMVKLPSGGELTFSSWEGKPPAVHQPMGYGARRDPVLHDG
jgi:hypothetical protein